MNKAPDENNPGIVVDIPKFKTKLTTDEMEKVIVIASLQSLVDTSRITALAAVVTATCALVMTAKVVFGLF